MDQAAPAIPTNLQIKWNDETGVAWIFAPKTLNQVLRVVYVNSRNVDFVLSLVTFIFNQEVYNRDLNVATTKATINSYTSDKRYEIFADAYRKIYSLCPETFEGHNAFTLEHLKRHKSKEIVLVFWSAILCLYGKQELVERVEEFVRKEFSLSIV